VFLGLGHNAVNSGNEEDSAVHLSSTGDHVLDVVSVARAVNVSVVTVVALVFNVRSCDREDLGGVTTALRFGSLCDLVVGDVVCETLEALNVRDSGGQRSFAMVNVSDGTNVDMRFCSFELFLCHVLAPSADVLFQPGLLTLCFYCLVF